MKTLFTVIMLAIFTLNPIIGQSKKELKAVEKQKKYENTQTLINSKQYEFTGEWATSNRGKRINLMSNPTYLKVEKTSGDGYFPFFGTGYSGSAYGSGGGAIEFKNELENYTVTLNDKKQEILIKFKAKGKNDTYDFHIRVFPGGNASITLNSNNRSVMNYSGNIKALEKKEAK